MAGMRILYYGGLWPTNMGNSFIDMGALYLLRKCCPDAIICQASRFSRFFASHRKDRRLPFLRNHWRPLDLAEHAEVDLVVLAGNVTDMVTLQAEGPAIRRLVSRGARLVILGGGRSTYSEEEADAFRCFMQSVSTYAFVSRDQATFDAFRDAAQISFPGIDSAFFISDAVEPTPLCLGDYVVCTFDDQETEKSIGLRDQTVLRARHYSFGIRETLRRKLDSTLVSDSPFDYISLYAGARAVYSDRVHACVAALAFGRRARLYSSTPRAHLFDEVGAGDIRTHLTQADSVLLAARKREEMEFLTSVFAAARPWQVAA